MPVPDLQNAVVCHDGVGDRAVRQRDGPVRADAEGDGLRKLLIAARRLRLHQRVRPGQQPRQLQNAVVVDRQLLRRLWRRRLLHRHQQPLLRRGTVVRPDLDPLALGDGRAVQAKHSFALRQNSDARFDFERAVSVGNQIPFLRVFRCRTIGI